MPEMDGFELSKNIRSLHGKKLPIILISANTLKDVNITEIPDFFDDYLMKPFVYLDLLKKIRVALDVTWVYQASPSLGQPSIGSFNNLNVMLPESHINDLLGLGRLGHVRALQEELEELELKFPECSTFLLSLREQVDNFNLEGFMKLLSEN